MFVVIKYLRFDRVLKSKVGDGDDDENVVLRINEGEIRLERDFVKGWGEEKIVIR